MRTKQLRVLMKTLRFFEEAAHGLVGKFMMIMLLLGGVSAQTYAENGAWAKYDAQTSTLTFTYGEKPTGDNVYDAGDTSNNFPGWHNQKITKVVFDESFNMLVLKAVIHGSMNKQA